MSSRGDDGGAGPHPGDPWHPGWTPEAEDTPVADPVEEELVEEDPSQEAPQEAALDEREPEAAEVPSSEIPEGWGPPVEAPENDAFEAVLAREAAAEEARADDDAAPAWTVDQPLAPDAGGMGLPVEDPPWIGSATAGSTTAEAVGFETTVEPEPVEVAQPEIPEPVVEDPVPTEPAEAPVIDDAAIPDLDLVADDDPTPQETVEDDDALTAAVEELLGGVEVDDADEEAPVTEVVEADAVEEATVEGPTLFDDVETETPSDEAAEAEAEAEAGDDLDALATAALASLSSDVDDHPAPDSDETEDDAVAILEPVPDLPEAESVATLDDEVEPHLEPEEVQPEDVEPVASDPAPVFDPPDPVADDVEVAAVEPEEILDEPVMDEPVVDEAVPQVDAETPSLAEAPSPEVDDLDEDDLGVASAAAFDVLRDDDTDDLSDWEAFADGSTEDSDTPVLGEAPPLEPLEDVIVPDEPPRRRRGLFRRRRRDVEPEPVLEETTEWSTEELVEPSLEPSAEAVEEPAPEVVEVGDVEADAIEVDPVEVEDEAVEVDVVAEELAPTVTAEVETSLDDVEEPADTFVEPPPAPRRRWFRRRRAEVDDEVLAAAALEPAQADVDSIEEGLDYTGSAAPDDGWIGEVDEDEVRPEPMDLPETDWDAAPAFDADAFVEEVTRLAEEPAPTVPETAEHESWSIDPEVTAELETPLREGSVDEVSVDEPGIDEPGIDEHHGDEPGIDEPYGDEPPVDEPVVALVDPETDESLDPEPLASEDDWGFGDDDTADTVVIDEDEPEAFDDLGAATVEHDSVVPEGWGPPTEASPSVDDDPDDEWVTGPIDFDPDQTAELDDVLHAGAVTTEHRGLAEEVLRSGAEDTQLQALSAAMPGLDTGVVGFDDVADLGTDEEVSAPARSDLGVRVITGLVLAGLLLGSLWAGGEALAVFVGAMLVLGLGEFYTTLSRRGFRPLALFGYVGGIGMLVGTWFYGLVAVPVAVLIVTVAVYFFYAFAPMRRDALTNGGLTILGMVWVAGAGAFAVAIFGATDVRPLVIAVAAVTVAMDVGAYAFGRAFGSAPLAPVLSPNKSIEGLAGGTIVAVGVAVAIGALVDPLDIQQGAALGLVVAATAPLGDLAESMVKRSLGVKDMGAILPGHGGVLDRVDAFLFVLPAAWVLFEVLGLLG